MGRMYTYTLLGIAVFLFAQLAWGQVSIYDANFSTLGGFDHSTSSPPAAAPQTFDGGNFVLGYDVAPATDGSGNFFRVASGKIESADFGGAAYFETDPIDISTVSEITITGVGVTVGSSVFNNTPTEFFQWSYIIDGGTPVTGPNITSDGSLNTPAAWSNIPVTGSQLVVRFDFNINGGSDGFDITEVSVEGTSSASPTVGFNNATSTENETNSTQTVNIPVTLSNYSTNVTLNVAVTGGSAEVGDYTLNTASLSFTGNGTQNISLDINDDADADDETVEITLTESTATGISISPALHTVTVNDDEVPATPQIVITEVGDPADIIDRRMVEICNRGTSSVDISGWALEGDFNGNTTVDFTISVPNSTILASGECYVFANNNFLTSGGDLSACVGYSLSGNISTNGNETFWINDGSSQIDVYDGQALNFENSIATRNIGVSSSNATFSSGEWSVKSGNASDLTPCIDAIFQLPVTLLTFTAKPFGGATLLTFSTATESGNSHFEVERSLDGRTFTKIGEVAGAGDSAEQIDYTFTDTKPAPGVNYYRLRQVDFAGTYEYFGPVAVRFGGELGEQPVRVWPVPARETLQVELLGEADSEWQLQVVDLNGRTLLQRQYQDKSLNTSLPIAELPAGAYFLRWRNGPRTGQTRFVKQ